MRGDYCRAFLEYLAHGGEASLRAGYELGRQAVREQLSVMDLAEIHHAVLASVLGDPLPGIQTERVTRSAAEFFLEALSAFEMVQRGFWEATEAARLEKEHGVRLRRLADASLAINSTLSLRGILQVAVDRSRLVIGARCAVAAVSIGERDA